MTADAHDDPAHFDLAPEEFRRLGYRFVDLMTELLTREGLDPVFRRAPGREVRALFDEPLPRRGSDLEETLGKCREAFLTYNRRNGHPRFFGYVCASADPVGMLADALASAANQIPTAWRSSPVATEIERLVVRWLDEMVGFAGSERDDGGSGLLVSGGSAANTHGLACALAAVEPQMSDRRRLVLYLSREAHMSFAKAARHLGLAAENLRWLAVDGARRLRVDALEAALVADRAAGLWPLCICASAGTANTGAVDPLREIADLAERHAVWLHIDGAYGAPAALTHAYAWMKDAFRRADSMSLDPHKWLFAPFDVGCALVRDAAVSRRAFALQSEYTAVAETDPIERYAFFDHGLELSRRFRALKVWMILKTRGVDALAAVIERNLQLCRDLDQRLEREPRLERLGSELSICCFRYRPTGIADGAALHAINQRILESLVAEGRFYMSPTTLDGRYALRVAIVNFRTSSADIELLVDEVLRLGGELADAAG